MIGASLACPSAMRLTKLWRMSCQRQSTPPALRTFVQATFHDPMHVLATEHGGDDAVEGWKMEVNTESFSHVCTRRDRYTQAPVISSRKWRRSGDRGGFLQHDMSDFGTVLEVDIEARP